MITKPKEKPGMLCMAPWIHTYLSPQTERRMCCASREPAQNFQQYIDSAAGSGKYEPIRLEQHWNSEHMRSVRRRMMNGETLDECAVCDNKLLNVSVYRDYFWHMFGHHYDEIWTATDADGYTSMLPRSWDYRFSNLCNFKCRMCGDMLSSSWETENKINNQINWDDSRNAWMLSDVRNKIDEFQRTMVEEEFEQAIEQHRVEEVYWVGGEPLMYEQHWRYMMRILELGDAAKVYARYNTNLSRCNYKGVNLFKDILVQLRDWQVCASLDGTGKIGEYIRTGLDYTQWLENFSYGKKYTTHRRQLRVDFTLTLPGLFELENIDRLCSELDVDLLAKVVFGFSPDVFMSPLILPRHILTSIIDQTLPRLTKSVLIDLLINLRQRPTFEEEYPDTWHSGVVAGKQRILNLERIRNDKFGMKQILQQHKDAHVWWENIRSN